MTPDTPIEPEQVLSFWLGPLGPDGLASAAYTERWWRKDAAFDAQIRAEFGSTWSALMRGAHDRWLSAPRTRLAYVIVLDQFSRNMFRGKAQAFAGDARALAAAREGVELGHDRALIGYERVFLYMPFMHSESLAVQEQCVQLFRAFCDESSGKLREELEQNVNFAARHRDIVARWGRFPHRNQQLDRTSTAEELEFLKLEGSSF